MQLFTKTLFSRAINQIPLDEPTSNDSDPQIMGLVEDAEKLAIIPAFREAAALKGRFFGQSHNSVLIALYA